MNIALFASAFYPHVGGVEELVRQLAHAYLEKGMAPVVMTNRWPKELPIADSHESVPVRRYNFRVPETNIRMRVGATLFGPGTLRDICNDLRKAESDVIHVQCVSSNGYYALLAKRRLKLPLIVTLQGELTMDANRVFQRSKFARKMLRQLLSEADAITACSSQTLNEAELFWGKEFGDRGSVIYNGISLKEFSNPTSYSHPRPYILGIGRHVREKGFDVLLHAFALSNLSGTKTHDLLLAGDGPERVNLEHLAIQLGIADRVLFTGQVNHQEAISLFSGCSFFVLPSRHEPMGIVNLEAMAAGKAVIVTRVGGVPEIVQEGVTGLFVPCEDVSTTATAIARLSVDSDLRLRLGEAGRNSVREFDWHHIADEYLSIYRRTGIKKVS